MLKRLISALILIATQARAEDRPSRFFELGKTDGPIRYTQLTHIETVADETAWNSQIKDVQGQVLMVEEAKLQSGRLVRQTVEQRQVGKLYELTLEDHQGIFRSFKLIDGKKGDLIETKTIEVDDHFVTGPMTEPFLLKHWSELLAGKKLEVSFGIFELLKAVDFSFIKISETQDTIEVRMKPASFWLSLLVDPLTLEFNKASKKLVRFIGRTPLKKKVNDDWKSVDAEILYP